MGIVPFWQTAIMANKYSLSLSFCCAAEVACFEIDLIH